MTLMSSHAGRRAAPRCVVCNKPIRKGARMWHVWTGSLVVLEDGSRGMDGPGIGWALHMDCVQPQDREWVPGIRRYAERIREGKA